jgi:hypothetical protein
MRETDLQHCISAENASLDRDIDAGTIHIGDLGVEIEKLRVYCGIALPDRHLAVGFHPHPLGQRDGNVVMFEVDDHNESFS